SILPSTAATANPVDLAGAGEQDTFSFARSTGALLASADADSVLFTAYFGGYSAQSEDLRDREIAVAQELVSAVARATRPLVVHTMYWDSPPARELRAAGVPVYRAIESAVAGLAALVADAEAARAPFPRLPVAAPPLSDHGYAAARAALADAGVPFAAA